MPAAGWQRRRGAALVQEAALNPHPRHKKHPVGFKHIQQPFLPQCLCLKSLKKAATGRQVFLPWPALTFEPLRVSPSGADPPAAAWGLL